MIIAVDFDGTIVEHKYPAIGRELPFAIETLRKLQSERHKLILWTVREGVLLEEALLGIWPVSLQRLIFEALILFKFRQHCSHRWTAALAVRQAWTLTVIKIWSEPFISQNWCI